MGPSLTNWLFLVTWIPGDLIVEQIVRSVTNSRKTIIILSRNYLRSKQANFEFQTAYEQALREGHTSVIVILIEDINLEGKPNTELEAYITTNTYLQWGDFWFWEKLRYAMSHWF